MVENSKVKIGIIGAGGIATGVHLPALSEIDEVKIMAVCDIIEEKADKAAEKYSIPKIYSLYKKMLAQEDLDAVFILVQPDKLFRIVIDSLDSGVDTFMEKPAGITSFQAETILRKAEDKNLMVQVGFNRRYIPLVQKVVDIMKETTEITQVEGCFFKNGSAAFYDGCASSFMCDTIHAIDMVRWIAGSQPVEVSTVQNKVNDVVPNSWNSVVRFENGVTGIIKANYQTGGRIHNFEIHGPEASAYINLGFGGAACEAKILFARGKGTYSLASAGSGNEKIKKLDGLKIAGNDKYYRYYGFYQEDKEFVESVKSNKTPLVDIKEAAETMHFVEKLKSNLL